MSTTQQDKSGDKPRQRNRKRDQRDRKPEGQQVPKLDQRNEVQIEPMMASADALANHTATPADAPVTVEVEPAHDSVGAVAPADNSSVNMQTIVNAYRDYTRTSFQANGFLVEKLMGVRSFDKAMEVQTEFARQAHASFVTQSQKICALYGELARQTFGSWQGFAAKANQAGVKSGSGT